VLQISSSLKYLHNHSGCFLSVGIVNLKPHKVSAFFPSSDHCFAFDVDKQNLTWTCPLANLDQVYLKLFIDFRL